MKSLGRLFVTLFVSMFLGGCTDHRDLYVDAKPLFVIKNDWSAANINPEGATAMLYARAEPYVPMYNDPRRHSLYLEPNVYDILVFNEVMFSPEHTNLDGITYRGTSRFGAFGAYSKPSLVNPAFKSEPGDIMVGYGYPEPLAVRTCEQREVLTQKEYVLKYQNGKNGFAVYGDFEADSVEMLPVRVTREVKVLAHVTNLKDKYRISATLSGFAEGVLLSSRTPDGGNASYAFDLNSAVPDPEREGGHLIVSKPFQTFGPWWNDYPSTRRYTLNVMAARGADLFYYNFDVTVADGVKVTKSVGEAIVTIKAEEARFAADETIPAMGTIFIEVWFDLPEVVDDSIDVGVGDWGSDIIVPVPIG